MRTNYYGAFIPSIVIGQNFSKSLNQSKYTIHKYQIVKKKNLNKHALYRNNNITRMNGNINSGEEYLSILKEEFAPQEKNFKTTIQSLSPAKKKLLSILVISSSLLSGWVFAPSRKPFVCGGFSLLAGSIGVFLTKKYNTRNELIIKKKIVESLNTDSDNYVLKVNLDQIAKENNLNQSELKVEISDVYKKFLEILLRNSGIDLNEIQILRKFKNILGLSPQEIGQCHYEFAQNLYKNYVIMLERSDLGESTMIVNKFFFLSDRIFNMDSAKGYQYESARIRKVFLFPEDDVTRSCKEKSIALYQNFVQNSLDNVTISSKTIKDIAEILGLDENAKNNINTEFYKQKISDILSAERKLTENAKTSIQNLQSLLNIDDNVSKQCFADKTAPIFFSELKLIMQKLETQLNTEDIDACVNQIKIQKENLIMSTESTEKNLIASINNSLCQRIENSLKFLRANNKKESIKEIEKILALEMNAAKLIEKMPEIKSSSLQSFNVGKNFKDEDVQKLYKVYLNDCLTQKSLSFQNEKNLIELQKLFGITANNATQIYSAVVSPFLASELRKIIEKKNFSTEDKEQIESLIVSLKIGKDIIIDVNSSIYQEFLKIILSKDSIPTQTEKEELENLRKFLSLTWNDVQQFHDVLAAPMYRKSLSEALGATGIIPKNYWEGLENLRKRLLISEKKAKEIFYDGVKDKLRISFEKAISDNKQKNQPKGSDNADSGDDPTITKGAGTTLGIEAGNPRGNELINMVDLYSKNNICLENEEVYSEIIQSPLVGQSGRAEIKNSAKAKITYSYPINLDGLFKKKTTTDMYRDYLVECFSVKSQAEKRKLFNSLEKLGPILGLNESEIESIHSSVGAVVYKQYLAQALTKGFLDKSEMAFLSNIQATLSMSSAKCSEFIREAKKNKVSLMIESIFATSKVNAERVSEMRRIAKQLGINLNKDLEISADQRSRMFRVEIDNAIELGKITKENQELIGEIQDGFGLDDNLSKKILLECISQRCENHLLNAVASLRKNSSIDVIQELEKMLNFGNLLPIQLKNPIVSKKERSELFSLYETNVNESLSPEQMEKKNNLLKLMLGLN